APSIVDCAIVATSNRANLLLYTRLKPAPQDAEFASSLYPKYLAFGSISYCRRPVETRVDRARSPRHDFAVSFFKPFCLVRLNGFPQSAADFRRGSPQSGPLRVRAVACAVPPPAA